MRTPSHPEAMQLLGGLRDLFPAGELPDVALDGYADLLQAYDAEVIVQAFSQVMHTREARSFPSWSVIEEALHAVSPAYQAWRIVAHSIEMRSNVPPEWPDPATPVAVAKLGGWTTLLEWDGSLQFLRDSFVREYEAEVRGADRAQRQIGWGKKTLNLTGEEHCAYCLDDGWVTLAGSVTHLGVTYDRGNTACRWCEAGEAVYRSVTKAHKTKIGTRWPGVNVANDYNTDDLHHNPGGDTARVTKEQYASSDAGRRDPALRDPAVREMIGLPGA